MNLGNGRMIGDENPIPIKGSALGAVSVAPSDTVDLARGATKGLYLGGTGNVKVNMSDGTTVTFMGLTGGVIHPISVKRVHATGTTASSILAVY